jgi:hypothetical protein
MPTVRRIRPTEPVSSPAPRMTEDQLLIGLLELLGLLGWRSIHLRRSDRALLQGAGAAGFPDIFAMAPGGRMLAIECKSDRGIPTPEQIAWLSGFRSLGVEATVIRPASYDAAIAWIRGKAPMPDARPAS